MINRTLLYYPSINIPDDAWLKTALLYSDKISSIVPEDINISDHLEYLKQEEQYLPILMPDYCDLIKWQELIADLENILDLTGFQQLLAAKEKTYTQDYDYSILSNSIHSNSIHSYPIHREKVDAVSSKVCRHRAN